MLGHLKEHIAHGLEITCPFQGCTSSFTVKSSFTSHLSRRHKSVENRLITPELLINSQENQNIIFENNNSTDFEEDAPSEGDDQSMSSGNGEIESDISDLFVKNLALFYLKLNAKYHVPSSTVQKVIEEMQSMHSISQNLLKHRIKRKLTEFSVEKEVVDEVVQDFISNDIYNSVHCEKGILSTNFRRKQFFKDNFRYVEPVTINLGFDKNKIKRTEEIEHGNVLDTYSTRSPENYQNDLHCLESDWLLDMDEVIKLIRHILPQLSPEVLENTQDKLVEIGVGDVIDLQHLEENDLTLVLRPIQIRKLLQHFKAVKNLILESLRSPSSSKDNSITTPANLNESLGSSSSSSRSSPMLFGDTDTQSDVDDISKTKCTAKPCTYWINDYKIPWNMFSKTLLEACTRKARPKPRERREMIRILCDDIRGFAAVPGRKNLSRIAQMMVAKYKDSFCDVIGDSVIGSGHESLLRQMEERIANLNRKVGKPAAKLSISSDDEDSEPKSKSRKTVIHDSYGCVNWQPESLPTDETTETQESKQDWLMEEFRKKEQDRKKVLLFMENTYTSQRLVINRNNPDSPIGEVKDKWPFLFEKECMFLHFEQLMGFKIQDVMQASLASKAKIIVEYLRQNHIQKKKIKQVLWRIEAAMSSKKDQQPVMIGVFLLLLAYFEEKQELMIRSDVDVSFNCNCYVMYYVCTPI
ncbi:hypothetical protein BSL78_01180 [Paramuricea clavata]|uniref:Uncharacterized protein n=1 Tax=Paramuricea clavata TaxID=317549 RepID=A0A6S7G6F6_PARCT|nr:hypothetical protein BSL78_01180 [Paramuricea clavata]